MLPCTLHSELKVRSHPGRPSWVRLVICQLGSQESVALRLVQPEAAPVACTICQGSYAADAPGTIGITFHLDCGNGYEPPQQPPTRVAHPDARSAQHCMILRGMRRRLVLAWTPHWAPTGRLRVRPLPARTPTCTCPRRAAEASSRARTGSARPAKRSSSTSMRGMMSCHARGAWSRCARCAEGFGPARSR